jgi:G:T-mismatch repair DNA endonuclease (very short patch repair protein)
VFSRQDAPQDGLFSPLSGLKLGHAHPTRAKISATRHPWWLAKIEGNKKRDRMQNRLLRNHGWTVIRIWQHELTPKHRAKALRKLRYTGLMGG